MHLPDHRQRERARMLEQRDHVAADQERDAAADERAERVHGDRAPELLLREVVGEHRVRAGRQRGFAHTDAHPRDEHLHEMLAGSARGGCDAPQRDAERDDPRPRVTIGEIGDGQPHHRIEQREREAVQQAELRVGQVQVALDRLDHQHEDLAVDEREDVREHADDDDIPFVRIALAGSAGRGCGHADSPGAGGGNARQRPGGPGAVAARKRAGHVSETQRSRPNSAAIAGVTAAPRGHLPTRIKKTPGSAHRPPRSARAAGRRCLMRRIYKRYRAHCVDVRNCRS